jgi:hypothetical protein
VKRKPPSSDGDRPPDTAPIKPSTDAPPPDKHPGGTTTPDNKTTPQHGTTEPTPNDKPVTQTGKTGPTDGKTIPSAKDARGKVDAGKTTVDKFSSPLKKLGDGGAMVKALGRLSAMRLVVTSAGGALLVASGAIANVPGMVESAGQWEQLKNEVKVLQSVIDQIQRDVYANWIADDRDAFFDVVQQYKRELDDVASFLGSAGATMSEVAGLYEDLWKDIAVATVTALGVVLALATLFPTPLGLKAKLAAEGVGATLTAFITFSIFLAQSTIDSITEILTMTGSGFLWATGNRLRISAMGGETGKEDFKQVTVDFAYKAPSVFKAPNKPLPS